MEVWETAPFAFVDGVEAAIARAQEFAGLDREVDVSAGRFMFGAGRPVFGAMGPGDAITLDNPGRVVQGDWVTYLLYDVSGSRNRRLAGE